MRTLLARQRIFDQQFDLYGYELLFRNNLDSVFQFEESNKLSNDIATSHVLANLFANLDIESVVGEYPAFINFSHNLLINKVPHLLPRNKVIIEILESVEIDDLLLKSVFDLKEMGYRIALDDFIFREELIPLIELADIIKIDVLVLNEQEIKKQLKHLSKFKGLLLAEKVENHQMFQFCIDHGFDLFQGFFLHKPNDVKGEVVLESRANLFILLDKFNNPNSTITDVAETIKYMPTMSYRILRLANSVMMYRGRKFDSVFEAIFQLGFLEIRNWISILLISSFDDISVDILERSLIRAKMCELLSCFINQKQSNQAYTVGLFSSLSDIFNQPLELLLSKIRLSEEINNALLKKEGWLGELLQAVLWYEEGHFEKLNLPYLMQDNYISAYMEAISHTNSIMDLLSSD